MNYEAITVIVDTIEGKQHFSVGQPWPKKSMISKELVEQAPPYIAQVTLSKINFVFDNGWAQYLWFDNGEVYDLEFYSGEYKQASG